MNPHSRVAFLLPGVPFTRGARPDALAAQGDTLGARLQRRRRELKLDRASAARVLGVSWKTLMWWERDEKRPFVHLYPAVIRYLGYQPWEKPSTLGQALLAERRRRGLEIRRAAELVGVDEGTWRRWERGEWKPTNLTHPAINHLLGYSARDRFRTDVR